MVATRRDFLRTAGLTATGALMAACTTPGGTRTPNSPRPSFRTPKAADWSALAGALAGRLLRPQDTDYATARLNFNPRFDTVHPAGIAYCESPHDVT